MRVYAIALACAAALSAGMSASAAEETMTAESELRCDIRKTVEGGLVRLEALAVSATPATGSYSLLLRKGGTGGFTQNRQGGAFSVGAGETRVLSTSTISVGPGDRFSAELTVEAGGLTRSCSVEG